MITHPQAMRLEADRWRAGIRSGEILCRCKGMLLPVDEMTGHVTASSGFKCGHSYGVGRVYELERAIGGDREILEQWIEWYEKELRAIRSEFTKRPKASE